MAEGLITFCFECILFFHQKKQKKAAKMKNLEAPTDEQSSEVTNVLFETVEKNSQNIKPSIGKKHCAEEIPQLVPIDEQTPAKKAKLQVCCIVYMDFFSIFCLGTNCVLA